jgi:hypothetical protein
VQAQVKPLHQCGSRITDQQIVSLALVEGYMFVYVLGGSIQISIYNGSANQRPLLPDLYDARLVMPTPAQDFDLLVGESEAAWEFFPLHNAVP